MGHHDAGGELGDLTRHPDEKAPLQTIFDRPLYGLPGEVPDLDEVDLFEVRQRRMAAFSVRPPVDRTKSCGPARPLR